MKNKKSALTLVELMISLVLFAVILSQFFQAFGFGNRLWDVSSNQLIRQKDARNVASYLARDIRSLTDNPASSVLDDNGDSFTLQTVDGAVTYSLAISGNEGLLSRAGSPIGQHIQSINLNVGASAVELGIVTFTQTILSGAQTYQLQTKVRRRND